MIDRCTLLVLLAMLGAGLVVACEDSRRHVSPTGSTGTDGIVVERTTLRSEQCCHPGASTAGDLCQIEGTVRNDTITDRKVTITFTAFDRGGQAICFVLCTTRVEVVVPAEGHANFSDILFAGHDCDKVARLEITQLQSEPVA